MDRTLRGYIQPGFAQEQGQREVEKLDAILQALNNCHRTLGAINGGEDAFLAQESIQAAYNYTAKVRQFKSKALQPTSQQAVIDVDSEELDDIDQFV